MSLATRRKARPDRALTGGASGFSMTWLILGQRKFAAIQHDLHLLDLLGVVMKESTKAALGVDEFNALR